MREPRSNFRSGKFVTGAAGFALLFLLLCVQPDCFTHKSTALAQSQPVTSINVSTTLEQELPKDSTKTFQIQLAPHQYVSILFEKGDLQLSLAVTGPRGESITEQISRTFEPVRVSFISRDEGVHQIAIRSLEKEEQPRTFKLIVETVRFATEQDQKITAARLATAEAVKLKLQWQEQALRDAISKYKEALTLWQSAGDQKQAAGTLESIGEIHFALGEYKQAFDQNEQARKLSRAARDRAGEMRQLVKAAYALINLGKPGESLLHSKAAQEYFSRALANSNSEHKRDEALWLNLMGEAYLSRGELRISIDYLNRALALSKEIKDRTGQALANRNLGYAYSDSGNLAEARRHFTDALSLYKLLYDRRGEALSQTGLGTVHSFIGEKQTALDLHTAAMNTLRALGDHQGEAVALNSIGKFYEDLNQLPTAIDNYYRALKAYQELGNQEFVAVTKYYLGRAFNSLGNKKQAHDYYEQSLSESERVGHKRIAAYALSGIGTLSSDEGRKAEALQQLRRALQLYRSEGDRRGQVNALNAIGDVYQSQKDHQEALRFYQEALPLARAAADRKRETDTLYNIARATSNAGNLPKALVVLEESLKIIEALRSQVVSPELRASYFASVSNHWELYIDLLMKMHWSQPDKGFAALAFQASENARARALIEMLSESGAQLREGVDPKLFEEERSLQQQMAAKAAYQMTLRSSKSDPAEVDETEKEIRRLTNAYQEIQTQIKQQSPRFASLVQPQPLKLDEIQAQLEDPDTLLEYSLGHERSYLWLVTRSSVSAYELPAGDTLEKAARNVYELLTARQALDPNALEHFQESVAQSDAQYWKEATILSQTLLGQVSSQLASRRLIIVADGALQYLPFAALPLTSLNNNSESNNVPMIVSNEIVNLPSASVLATLRRTERSVNGSKGLVAIIADPVFEKDDPRLTRSKSVSNSNGAQTAQNFQTRDLQNEAAVSRLPASRQEAESIMAVTPSGTGKMITDFEACRTTAMSGELAGYSIVHFATHGVINTEHPEMSGILLSKLNRDGQSENGFLQVHDIYNLNLANTELVVLSACRTALGRDIRGEGLVGLTRGFMHAGTKSVIASLWKVDDRATAELMKHFYRGMFQERLTPAAALRKAKITMLNHQRWSAPYFWAAFTLQGEYRNQIEVPTQKPGSRYTLMVAIVATAAALLVIFFLYARRPKTKSP